MIPTPHFPDSERAIVSCAMIDAADTLTACAEAGVAAASFFLPAERIVFEAISTMVVAGLAVDLSTVAVELRKANLLSAVGGVESLSAMADLAPTSAHRSYHIEQVRIAAGCRSVITSARAAIERAASFSGTVEDFASEIGSLAAQVAIGSETKSRTLGAAVDAVAREIEEEIAGTRNRGVVSISLPTLDRTAGLLAPGELVIVAARPGCGKTSLAMQVATAAARSVRVLVFTLEMSDDEVLRVMAAQRSGIPARGIVRAHKADQLDYLAALRSLKTEARGMRIYEHTQFPAIAATCRAEAMRGPLGLIIVDYLQLVEGAQVQRNAQREQQVAAISRGLKQLARSLRCPVLCMAQLNRASEAESRPPRLSDLRESGSIEQDANRVLFLHRPDATPDGHPQSDADLVVYCRATLAKHRSGPTGQIWVRFEKPAQRITEAQPTHQSE